MAQPRSTSVTQGAVKRFDDCGILFGWCDDRYVNVDPFPTESEIVVDVELPYRLPLKLRRDVVLHPNVIRRFRHMNRGLRDHRIAAGLRPVEFITILVGAPRSARLFDKKGNIESV